MNAVIERTSEIGIWSPEWEVSIPPKYLSRIEQIKSKELALGMINLVKRIIKRMNSGNLDKVQSLIHEITLEYTLHGSITMQDRQICIEIYLDLLWEYDRLFDDIFPNEVRKRKDQILQKTPR